MKTAIGIVAREANDYVAGWLQRQPAVKEESITDWLLDFFQQKTPDVRYYEFDRHEEARFSGADWDWWFLLRNGCFKMRVQAKKIKPGKDHYSELARSNQTGYQIDLLLDSSAQHNFYPLYVLYARTEGVERCQRPPRPIVLSICSAQETYELVFGSARRRIESGDILALSIPLECLFCCPLVLDFRSHGPQELFRRYFMVSPRGRRGKTDAEDADFRRGYEESIPRIIRTLFEMREINDNTEGNLREYQSIYAGTRGVTIVRVENNDQQPGG
ncbi:MAG: hypothetical protein NT002_09905 [candidate division Zixibacteria bacterium]|nr:hypothetical protein [candidate division Zixibacteria bacterium]